MRFSILRSVGWGVVLYASMYLAFALLATYGYAGTLTARISMLAVLLFTTLIATRTLSHLNKADKVPYACMWVLTIAALDALFAAPTGSWAVFADPNLWIGYGLVFATPLVAPLAAHAPEVRHQS
jgi:hypothetical protein